MKTQSADVDQVLEALGALRQELARLSERVAALESVAAVRVQPNPAPAAVPAAAKPEALEEELLVVIGAAIAAFLGKKPHIRQVRLLGTAAWSQQGRVTIQASHAVTPRHTRSTP
jgi:methylmalonyl-CoA carboxyltransferase large subunit